LVIILDTVRATSLSLYGRERATTPKLEQLAREGAAFDYAFAPAPWTLPSHASMFTGRRATELSAGDRAPLDAAFPTIAESFRDRGWSTAGFVANVYYAGHDSGLRRGFARWEDYRTTLAQILWSSTLAQMELAKRLAWSTTWGDAADAVSDFDLGLEPLRFADRKAGHTVTDQFLDWQAEQGERPFFAFLNYFDAHAAYLPPGRYRRLFSRAPSQLDLYESCIRYLDDELDRLFTALRARGALDNTIVVVASDHGEYFGEHGKTGHGNGLHQPVLRVPLVIRYPARVPAGTRVARAVSLSEIPATLLDLAGARDARFPGRSLARYWRDDGGSEDGGVVVADLTGPLGGPPESGRSWHALATDDLLLIRSSDGREELYAYRDDPGEARDLSERAARDGRLRARRDSLGALLAGAPR
ncbi:MAG TPA: sulfatase, partial [Gemmatimonadaceae bacterium]|nr:sulfatase [Gemmatimonadaceae bacterium]